MNEVEELEALLDEADTVRDGPDWSPEDESTYEALIAKFNKLSNRLEDEVDVDAIVEETKVKAGELLDYYNAADAALEEEGQRGDIYSNILYLGAEKGEPYVEALVERAFQNAGLPEIPSWVYNIPGGVIGALLDVAILFVPAPPPIKFVVGLLTSLSWGATLTGPVITGAIAAKYGRDSAAAKAADIALNVISSANPRSLLWKSIKLLHGTGGWSDKEGAEILHDNHAPENPSLWDKIKSGYHQQNTGGLGLAQGGMVSPYKNAMVFPNYETMRAKFYAGGGEVSSVEEPKTVEYHGREYTVTSDGRVIDDQDQLVTGRDKALLKAQAKSGFTVSETAERRERRASHRAEFIPSPRTMLEFVPIIGDILAAEELYQELNKSPINWTIVGILGGGLAVGLIPGVGDAIQAGGKVAVAALRKGGEIAIEGAQRGMADTVGIVRAIKDGDTEFLKSFRTPTTSAGAKAVRDPLGKESEDLLIDREIEDAWNYSDERQGDLLSNPDIEFPNRNESAADSVDIESTNNGLDEPYTVPDYSKTVQKWGYRGDEPYKMKQGGGSSELFGNIPKLSHKLTSHYSPRLGPLRRQFTDADFGIKPGETEMVRRSDDVLHGSKNTHEEYERAREVGKLRAKKAEAQRKENTRWITDAEIDKRNADYRKRIHNDPEEVARFDDWVEGQTVRRDAEKKRRLRDNEKIDLGNGLVVTRRELDKTSGGLTHWTRKYEDRHTVDKNMLLAERKLDVLPKTFDVNVDDLVKLYAKEPNTVSPEDFIDELYEKGRHIPQHKLIEFSDKVDAVERAAREELGEDYATKKFWEKGFGDYKAPTPAEKKATATAAEKAILAKEVRTKQIFEIQDLRGLTTDDQKRALVKELQKLKMEGKIKLRADAVKKYFNLLGITLDKT